MLWKAHSRTSDTIESGVGDTGEGDSGFLAADPGESVWALTGLVASTDRDAIVLPILGRGSREGLVEESVVLDEEQTTGESGTSKASSASATPADAAGVRTSIPSFSFCSSSFSAAATAEAEGAIFSSGGGLLRLKEGRGCVSRQ